MRDKILNFINVNNSLKERYNKEYAFSIQKHLVKTLDDQDTFMLYDIGGIEKMEVNFMQKEKAHKYKIGPLFIACAKGNLDQLNLLLMNKSVDLETKGINGENAFWIACFFNHSNIMVELANRGIDIFNSVKGINALHIACIRNNPMIVQMLL